MSRGFGVVRDFFRGSVHTRFVGSAGIQKVENRHGADNTAAVEKHSSAFRGRNEVGPYVTHFVRG